MELFICGLPYVPYVLVLVGLRDEGFLLRIVLRGEGFLLPVVLRLSVVL